MNSTGIRGILALAALMAAGCNDAFGPGMGRVTVSLSRTGEAPAASDSAPAGEGGAGSSGLVRISPSDVASLRLSVTSIQFLRAEAGDSGAAAGDSGSAWTTLELSAPVELDLMTLPTEDGSSPLVIASGAVAAGTYGQLRLFVSNPRIVFSSDITIGVATMFEAGVEYQVEIPSSGQTGIKTDVSFTVEAAAEGGATTDVGLVFDEGASFANVTATGNARVIMAPVIRARGGS
jgi:hypothetical protein